MKLKETEIRKMIKVAALVRRNAFILHSSHRVGASVLTDSGEIYGGCNVQSVISGLGTCAERSAIDHAVSHGKYSFRAVCVIDEGHLPPCGACLQYMLLFSQVAGKDIQIVCADTKGRYRIYALSKLLPLGYRTKRYLRKMRSYGKRK
jgi:homotetrameric cytidine deaminase